MSLHNDFANHFFLWLWKIFCISGHVRRCHCVECISIPKGSETGDKRSGGGGGARNQRKHFERIDLPRLLYFTNCYIIAEYCISLWALSPHQYDNRHSIGNNDSVSTTPARHSLVSSVQTLKALSSSQRSINTFRAALILSDAM